MINELLNIQYPIFQGAMANISDGKFASVVSNAGALGTIASGGMDKDMLKNQIRICKENTNNPFAVNLVMFHPQIEEMVDIVIEEKVPVVTTGAGNPVPYIEKLKNANIKVIPVVPNVTIAKKVERYGADAVIAEGNESGGHIGYMTTITILGEMIGQVNIPVVSAGGISNAKSMIATQILGASGFQIGIFFLATYECPIHENYKNAIIKASSSDVTVTGNSIKMPVRLLKNDMSIKYLELEKKGAEKIDLEKYTMGSLKKSVIDGDINNGSVMAGLSVGQVSNIKTVKKFIDDLMSDYYLERKKVGQEYAKYV